MLLLRRRRDDALAAPAVAKLRPADAPSRASLQPFAPGRGAAVTNADAAVDVQLRALCSQIQNADALAQLYAALDGAAPARDYAALTTAQDELLERLHALEALVDDLGVES